MGYSGVLGDPDDRGAEPVGVQVHAVELLTLLLPEALTWRQNTPKTPTLGNAIFGERVQGIPNRYVFSGVLKNSAVSPEVNKNQLWLTHSQLIKLMLAPEVAANIPWLRPNGRIARWLLWESPILLTVLHPFSL